MKDLVEILAMVAFGIVAGSFAVMKSLGIWLLSFGFGALSLKGDSKVQWFTCFILFGTVYHIVSRWFDGLTPHMGWGLLILPILAFPGFLFMFGVSRKISSKVLN